MYNINQKEKRELTEIKQNIIHDGHDLLYLCKFGSHLYGTNSESSDIVVMGIFLPGRDSALLGKMPKHYTSVKHNISIQIWSLQYWMELISRGETNALDLLYSYTHPEMVITCDARMNRIFSNTIHFFDVARINSHIGYSIGESIKVVKKQQNKDINWKPLSNDIRVIEQTQQILIKGFVQYPITNAEKLKKIEMGEYTLDEVEKMISNGIERINNLRDSLEPVCVYDPKMSEIIILGFYN